MIRKLLAAGAVLITGYLVGLLFGYRAAVVDYVENDAKTIRSMADTMYETASKEDLPEEVQEAIEEADSAETSNSDDRKGFQ